MTVYLFWKTNSTADCILRQSTTAIRLRNRLRESVITVADDRLHKMHADLCVRACQRGFAYAVASYRPDAGDWVLSKTSYNYVRARIS